MAGMTRWQWHFCSSSLVSRWLSRPNRTATSCSGSFATLRPHFAADSAARESRRTGAGPDDPVPVGDGLVHESKPGMPPARPGPRGAPLGLGIGKPTGLDHGEVGQSPWSSWRGRHRRCCRGGWVPPERFLSGQGVAHIVSIGNRGRFRLGYRRISSWVTHATNGQHRLACRARGEHHHAARHGPARSAQDRAERPRTIWSPRSTEIPKPSSSTPAQSLSRTTPYRGRTRSGHQGDSDYSWIIDPLDGTTNYLQGIPHFGISIAADPGRQIEHAIIVDPLKNDEFIASRGHGAQLNGKRIRVNPVTRLEDALLNTGIPPGSVETDLDATWPNSNTSPEPAAQFADSDRQRSIWPTSPPDAATVSGK